MITNVHRAKASGDIQRYIRYTIAPEEDQKNENYKHGERTLAIEANNVFIGSNVERNKTSRELEDQFIKWNEEHRTGKKPPKSPAVLGVISFTKQDTKKFYSTTPNGTEYLDHQKIIEIAREAVCETMGGDRPMYFALHGDKDHLHVHFAAGIVDSRGKIWDASKMLTEDNKKVSVRDFRTWERVNEGLEQKYGLDTVQHRKAFEHQGEHRQAKVARPTNAAIHLAERGELTQSMDLAGRLAEAYMKCNKQFDQFLELAEQNGIRIKPNMGSTKVNGLSFACEGMDGFIKASDLGNKYKWAKLEKDLNYDSSRDYQKLAEIKDRTSTHRPAINPNSEIERLTRNTNSIESKQRELESSRNASQELGNNERTEHSRVVQPSERITPDGTFEGAGSTDSITRPDTKNNNEGLDTVWRSPSYVPNNDIRNVASDKQTVNSGITTDNTRQSEQNTLQPADNEAEQIKRKERAIQNLITRGAMSRTEAEYIYNTEKKNAEATPVPKANLGQVADSFNASLNQGPSYTKGLTSWSNKMSKAKTQVLGSDYVDNDALSL